MKGRDKLFFNLLTFLMLVAIGLVGWQTREVDKQIKRWRDDIAKRAERGMKDPVLKETVDKLEADLTARMEERFILDPDPLDLTRVIKSKDYLKRLGLTEAAATDNRMRLSATVVSESGSGMAIIKYRGRNHVLAHDGEIAGYKVQSIGTNSIELRRGGERLVLKTEKSPESQAAEQMLLETMPKFTIDVKKVPAN